ncbi:MULTISPECIES: hypothetical protein [Mycolicibacter]|uniref:Nucleotidyl transferase n=2 Tax=Mycolicibacter TaxID=1073531 RepID=A0ABU5XLQ6_9MYCO|nr:MULTISPECIES: hypothetical protein [unclassified Mycolicibacter]MEB3022919.1 hypothetical protein [Mycolicibacter sp. MYC098]MEB3034986.1 hypothetical protein [Mycolicibacter sp. MYC340]
MNEQPGTSLSNTRPANDEGEAREMRGDRMDRQQLIGLLNELGEKLAADEVLGELFVVGGAAMALAYDARRLTSDVDGVFEPKSVVYEAAQRVAAEHPEISENWLNDAVKGFLPGEDAGPQLILEVPGLRVSVPSTEYLLATKVLASRIDRDDDDIRFLAAFLGLTTADQVLDVVARFYSSERIEAKVQFYIQSLFQ